MGVDANRRLIWDSVDPSFLRSSAGTLKLCVGDGIAGVTIDARELALAVEGSRLLRRVNRSRRFPTAYQ